MELQAFLGPVQPASACKLFPLRHERAALEFSGRAISARCWRLNWAALRVRLAFRASPPDVCADIIRTRFKPSEQLEPYAMGRT